MDASSLIRLGGLIHTVAPTLIQRLAELMQAKDWTHADLMRVSGQSSSVVSQWLGKGSKVIKTIGKMEAAQRLEAESGYAALWIAKGIGPKMADAQPAAVVPIDTQCILPPAYEHRARQLDAQRLGAFLYAVAKALDEVERMPLGGANTQTVSAQPASAKTA